MQYSDARDRNSMQPLTIAPRKDSPAIRFDPESGELAIVGDSYPENAAAFYEPVFEWIEAFLATVGDRRVTLNLQLTYINSSSSKIMLNLLDLLDETVQQGASIEVNWRYHAGNQTLLECGEEFAEDLEVLPFHFEPLAPEAAS